MKILIHYSEIALKRKNRRFFENKLAENIGISLKGLADKVKRIHGAIFVELKPKADVDEIKEKLQKIFGIAYFVIIEECPADMEKIEKKVVEILKDKEFKTFRIETKRSDKNFPFDSQKISAQLGASVLKKIKNVKVDLHHPELTVFVEISPQKAFVYFEKIQGAGGMPIGSGGRAVALLSGGIDSPVAAWRVMKRGVNVIFVHFHSYPQTSRASEEKVKELAGVLKQYQNEVNIYMVPFLEIQKEIMTKTIAPYRVIMYRRFMIRIAEEIAKKEGALALVTGESLAQVASQTIENINTVNRAARLPILRPLIGYDKEEIIREAKKIGTYEISIEPHDDCCTVFIPRNPATKSYQKIAENEEKKIDILNLLTNALKETKVIKI